MHQAHSVPITLDGDTYVVEDGASFICYAPFSDKIARVTRRPMEGTAEREALLQAGFFAPLPSHVHPDASWNGFTSLTLLLTRRCNLQCIYCYAKATPSGERMPMSLALAATKWYIQHTPREHLRITFHGGGEPTLEADTIRAVYDLCESLRGSRAVRYYAVTNGTCTTAFLDWMLDRGFRLSVSADGPPSIQDRNRPTWGGGASSPFVERAIRHIVARKFPLSVRATFAATDPIDDIVAYFGTLGVWQLHLEPLFPHGRAYDTIRFGDASDDDVPAPDAQALLDAYLRASDVAKQYGMRIYNGHLSAFRSGTAYFCGAAAGRAMVVNHAGGLTACHEVLDQNDPAYAAFLVGAYDGASDTFAVDTTRVQDLQARHPSKHLACAACFARTTCAGGCAAKAYRESGSFTDIEAPMCGFIRGLIPQIIRRIATASGID